MDTDVVEIPPRISGILKIPNDKGVTLHEVIEINEDEDSADVLFISEGANGNNKGKAIQTVYDDYFDNVDKEARVNNFLATSGKVDVESMNEVESSKTLEPYSHNIINLDSPGSDQSNDYCDCNGLFADDFVDVDKYAQLQSFFDNADIPPGIEAPIPWLSDSPEAPVYFSRDSTPAGGSSFQISHKEATNHPPAMDWLSASLHAQLSQSKMKSGSVHQGVTASKSPVGAKPFRSRWQKPFLCRKKAAVSSSSINYSTNQLDAMIPPLGVKPPFWKQYNPANAKTDTTNFSSSSSLAHTDTSNHPPEVEQSLSLIQDSLKFNFQSSFFDHTAHPSIFNALNSVNHPNSVEVPPWVEDYGHSWKNTTVDNSSTNSICTISSTERDEILGRFQLFKQFETVEDHSDHHYTSSSSSTKHQSKCWVKRIQDEWKILEKDLPDTIFVRVYETRMDLLRAVIVGADGTPYHDGLFFFDVFFPSSYPKSPPHVHYHSWGLRLNPNLYNSGKVCLSLLNTWSGGNNEKWIPDVSTMLQVLVSIQGLILNTKPYFNEPGYEHLSGSPTGEMMSQQYNENTFILSLKTMIYTIRKRPKHFEDFIVGHFYGRAHNILVACKAYIDGAQVGCVVIGGVQDVDAGDKSCSSHFKESLTTFLQTLVDEFLKIGVDCEKFLSPAINGSIQSASEVAV